MPNKLFDGRTNHLLLESRHNPPGFASLAEGRPNEVLWLDGLGESWFFLGRPQYMSAQQPVGSVFSRALAMEWQRRARALVDIGLVPASILAPHGATMASPAVGPAELAAFCRRADAPGVVILPQRDGHRDSVAAGAVRWQLPAPIWIPDDVDAMPWHSIEGYVALPCAPART